MAATCSLDRVQGRDHFADALAGEILEIAGLVDPHDLVLDVLGKPALVIGLERGGERLGAVVDDLRSISGFCAVAFSMPSTAAPSSPAARAMRRSLPSPISAASSRLLRAMVSRMARELALQGLCTSRRPASRAVSIARVRHCAQARRLGGGRQRALRRQTSARRGKPCAARDAPACPNAFILSRAAINAELRRKMRAIRNRQRSVYHDRFAFYAK